MVEDYCGIAEIFVRDVHETLYSDRAPPKAIAWDHARLSIQIWRKPSRYGCAHSQNGPGKTDEGNLTCGALFPAVTIAFGIQLARSLSLSLSLPRFVANFLRTMSYVREQCHTLEGLFSDNLSDNHLLHSVPWPSHGAITKT